MASYVALFDILLFHPLFFQVCSDMKGNGVKCNVLVNSTPVFADHKSMWIPTFILVISSYDIVRIWSCPESEWLRSLHKRMWSYKMWSYLVIIQRREWDHGVWPWEYMAHFVMCTCEQTLRSLQRNYARWSKLVFPSRFFYLPQHYSAFAFCLARFCKICIFKQSSI